MRLGTIAAVAVMCAGAPAYADLSRGGKIHVAAIQVSEESDDLAANQANVERLVREAATRGARYIVLPEYYPGQLVNKPGMTLEEVRSRAETVEGALTQHILRLCRELKVYVAFPLSERRADGHVYNSTVYAGPDGIEGVYSKTVLINMLREKTPPRDPAKPRLWQEDEIFTPGKTDGVLTWGGVRVGALICADGGFPNFYEMRVDKGVQLIVHASASAGVKTGESNPMPNVAARRYGRPVVFANHWEDKLSSMGNSQICDAQGNILAHVGRKSNAIVDAVVALPPVPNADRRVAAGTPR
jgi:N-carbamoylputrescine amidase